MTGQARTRGYDMNINSNSSIAASLANTAYDLERVAYFARQIIRSILSSDHLKNNSQSEIAITKSTSMVYGLSGQGSRWPPLSGR